MGDNAQQAQQAQQVVQQQAAQIAALQQQLQQLQAQQANQGITAQQLQQLVTALQAPQVAQGPAVVYASTPANAVQGVIDYNSKAGSLVFAQATKALSFHFALEVPVPNVSQLQMELAPRIERFGWHSITTWHLHRHGVLQSVSILTDFRTITLPEVTTHVDTYKGNNRNWQNDQQLLICLQDSITSATMWDMLERKDKYTTIIPGDPTAVPPTPAQTVQSGLLFLFLLLTTRKINNRQKINAERAKLTNLPSLLTKHKDNIVSFHKAVTETLRVMKECGAEYPEAITNLFRAYKGVNCEKFHRKIDNLEEDWNDAKLDLPTPHDLMSRVEDLYVALTTANEYKHNPKDLRAVTDAIVTALAARTPAKTPRKPRDKAEKGKPPDTDSDPPVPKPRSDEDRTPPKDGETQREIRGIKKHWCEYHKYWTSNEKHTSNTCFMNPKNKTEKTTTFAKTATTDPDTQTDDDDPAQTFLAAVQASMAATNQLEDPDQE